jgi:hypothetical protein
MSKWKTNLLKASTNFRRMITFLLSQKALEMQETMWSVENIRLNELSFQNDYIQALLTFCNSERKYRNSLQRLSIR